MTLQTQTNKVTYNGLIGQDTFAYNFRVDEKEDMFVYLAGIVISAGDFTMDGLGEDVGGNVILNTPLIADQSVTLVRTVPFTQLVDYQPFDSFPAETHESALDNLTMLTQQLQEEVDRAYKSPIDSEPGQVFQMPPYDAGKFLAWDETEVNILVNSDYSQADLAAEADRSEAAADSSEFSAGNSAASAVLSEDFADEDENVPVQNTGLFSAKHWAIQASKSVGGLRLRAIIAGDDTCPKPGDEVGECIVPDTRNPGQRFGETAFLDRDYCLISNNGTMELKDINDPEGPMTIQNVVTGDYIILMPELLDGTTVVIGEGWYKQEALSGGAVSANLVSFDDTGTITKGTDVQIWNSALDAQVLRLIGGTVTGQIKGIFPVDAVDLTRKDYVDAAVGVAQDTAVAAIGDAADAQATADTALANAATADGKAVAAQSTADAAQATADAAQATAFAAKPKSDFTWDGSTLTISNV